MYWNMSYWNNITIVYCKYVSGCFLYKIWQYFDNQFFSHFNHFVKIYSCLFLQGRSQN